MKPYGLSAFFDHPDALLRAALAARKAGFQKVEAYSPFPIPELEDAVNVPKDRVALLALLGGVVSGSLGYFMQWYANVVDYPINVGGRPYHSWPAFIPITFELTILGAALSASFGMLILNRLPFLSHPIFMTKGFERASMDQFILCIRSDDLKYQKEGLIAVDLFLKTLQPHSIAESGAYE